jgi:hypothetical protein
LLGLTLGVSLLGACSDAPDDAGAAERKPTASDTAVLTALMIRDPEGYTDYLMASADLPSGTIDTSRGIELSGGNYYSTDSALYYKNFELNSLQRYVVDKQLDVQLDGEISLANYSGCTPIFFSDASAYCIDVDDGLLVAFDPTAMEITEELAAPELVRRGYTGEVNRAQRVGDRYLASIVYSNDTSLAEDSTIAIAIEADAKNPLRVLHDERAVSADSAFTDDDGNYYALADGGAGYWSLVEGQTIQPRLLRVQEGSVAVDSDYLLDLGALLDTPAVNGLWPLQDKKFVLQVWRGSETGEDTHNDDDLDVQPNWDWYIVDAETEETTPITALGRSSTSYSLLRFVVDEQLYLQQYVIEDADYNRARVELYRVDEDARVEKVLETQRGDLRSITRVKIAAD